MHMYVSYIIEWGFCLNFILFCLCLVSEGGVVGEVLFQKLLGESYI